MSKYQVTIPVTFIVEIDENNTTVAGPRALQGNSATVALRRAEWRLFRSDIRLFDAELAKNIRDAQKPLGIKYIITNAKQTVVTDITDEQDTNPIVPPPGGG